MAYDEREYYKENREKKLEYARTYRLKHHDELLKKGRERREKNREKIREYKRAWNAAHPEARHRYYINSKRAIINKYFNNEEEQNNETV